MTVKEDVAIDEQTGKAYELKKENWVDHTFAVISGLYLLLMMAFFLWQMFDIWIGQYSLANLVGYPNVHRLTSPSFKLVIFAFIGGALGGIVNGIRSFLSWHAERYAFGSRFVWNYLTAPWMGAALALFTFALLRSGVAVLDGSVTATSASLVQTLTTFSIGVLSGYGSRKVFIWLDAQVVRIFQVPPQKVFVPKVIDLTSDEAEKAIKSAHLNLG